MIDRQTVFDIHRLKNEGYSIRKISRLLGVNFRTVARYLENPIPRKGIPKRASKLDPFKPEIKRILEHDPSVSTPVVKQRIESLGFTGGETIVRQHLRKVRKNSFKKAFIRFESAPGQQMQIDWGHFGSLSYNKTNRKLYALAVVESYSRMIYVEFTHSQKQEVLHQALLNAFTYFGGTPKEIVVDNMLTAVIERQGSVVRFNDAFLDFLTPFSIVPVACNIGAPHEKGKIEAVIKYIRINFWPLRSFKDLVDVEHQVRKWLDTVANIRIHQNTGESPQHRFARVNLQKLPDLPDCRETRQLKVYKDFSVNFDSNKYTTPPWLVGKEVTLKADQRTVTIYHRQKKVAAHPRSWEKRKRIEIPSHQEQVKKLQKKLWQDKQIAIFISLGQDAVEYLQGIVKAKQPIKKNILRLLQLKDEYGAASLIMAIRKAKTHKAYGADYIENILYQEMTPVKTYLPVKLKNDDLNRIRLVEPCLEAYDAYAIKKESQND